MKKRVLASVLACAMAFHILSPLEKITPEETASDHSIDRVTGNSTSPYYGTETQSTATLSTDSWDEIATLSLAEQLALSQIVPIAGSSVDLGTSATPFLLSNVAQLLELATYVNKGDPNFNAAYYRLTQDVSLSSVENWTAIGDSTNNFQGSFDGDGHVISDMTITSSDNNQGFFGYTNGATIENLGVVDCSVKGDWYISGLIGSADDTTIEKCYLSGALSGGSRIGGLVGSASDVSISNSYVSATVSGSGDLGGLVGTAYGTCTIQNCYATGAITGTSGNIGGLVAYLFSDSSLSITNSVALNPSVSGYSSVNRVFGSGSATLSDNYAWSGMSVNGNTVTSNDGSTSNGADLTYSGSTLTKQFSDIFGSSNTAWSFTTNGLPTLVGVGGNQSSDIPYYMRNSATEIYISTVPQLQALATEVNNKDNKSGVTYILMNDLDLSGVAWTPIGDDMSTAFQGTFEGNNYVISNLTINNPTADNQGLFGYVIGATIQNLGVVDCDVSGNMYVGGLVGFADTTKTNITNCYTTGTVIGVFGAGGLMGLASNTNITNCYTTATVTATGLGGYGWYAGGLVAQLAGWSTVQNCYATGAVTGNSNYVGGLVGSGQESTIQNCYATGAVTGTSYVGGLVGAATYLITISNCYATGAVTSTGSAVGGLVGETYESTIQSSVALNPSVSGGSAVNRVVGVDVSSPSSPSVLADNYAWNSMTVEDSTGSVSGTSNAATVWGADLTYSSPTLSPQLETIFDGSVAGSAWTYTPDSLPTLVDVGGTQSSSLPSHITGLSSPPSTSIYTVAELEALATEVNNKDNKSGVTYILMNDLDLSGVAWTPIGTYGKPFKGTFDGNGYVISNLTINNPSSDEQGLFGYTDDATIQNLGIENCNVSGKRSVGGLVGYVDNSKIENCYVTGTVKGYDLVGGLVGYASYIDISGCYATGAVTGVDDVGGLVGGMGDSCTISNCYATGAVTGTGNNVGGLLGRFYSFSSAIKNSVALNPSVSGTSNVNRVVGINNPTNPSSPSVLSGNYAWKDMLVNSAKVTDGTSSNENGENISVLEGMFVKADGSSVYDDTAIFPTSVWTIPTASGGDYMLLPTLNNVGNDVPSIYLSQTVPSQVTVTFNVDGGSAVADQETVGNKLATLPTEPTKSGHEFDGWYLENTFTTPVTTETEFKVDTTVYAKWLKIPTASDFVFTAPTPSVYDGNGKEANVTANGGVTGAITIKYYESDGTTSVASPTDVGTYVVKIDVTAGGDFVEVTDLEVGTFSITPKPLADTMINAISDETYTGSALTPSFTVEDSGTPLTKGTDFNTVTYSNNTNVGTATVTITGMGNYSGTATKDFNITNATISDTTTGTESVTYTGNQITPILPTGSSVDGTGVTVMYSSDGTNYDLSAIPSYTNAETYTIKYQLSAPNHEDFIGTIIFTIKKATVDNLVLDSYVVTPVKGATPDMNAVSDPQYTGTVTWSPTDSPFLASTVYTATVTLTATDNYTFIGVGVNTFSYSGATVTNTADSGSVTLVFPATAEKSLVSIVVTTPPTKTAYVYGDDFDDTDMVITATYDDNSTAVVSGYSNDGTNLQVTDTAVTVSYTENGVTQTVDVPITVGKAPLTANNFNYTAPSALEYSGTGKEADVVGKVNGSLAAPTGTVAVKYFDSGNNLVTTPTDVGPYTVKIDVATDDNYEAISNLTDSWTFTISEYTLTGTQNFTQTVQKLTGEFTEPSIVGVNGETVSGDFDYGTSTSYGMNKTAVETHLKNSATSPVTMYYEFTPSGNNYTGKVTGTIVFTLEEISFTISDSTLPSTTATYGDSWDTIFVDFDPDDYEAMVGTDTVSGNYTLTVNGNAYTGTDFPEVSSSPYTWEVTFTGGAYTNIPVCSGSITIAPRELTLSWTDFSLLYTGNSQTPTVTATNLVGTDTVDLTVSGGKTDVGTGYTATAELAASYTNYTLPSSTTITFSIEKGSSDMNIPSISQKYSYGDEISFTFTPTIQAISTFSLLPNTAELRSGSTVLATATESGDGSYTLTYDTSGKKLAIGTHSLTVEYGGSGNLNSKTTTFDLTLDKKTITATVSTSISKEYDGTTSVSGSFTLSPLSGDNVTVSSGTCSFDDKNVGTGKAITFTSLELDGDDKDFYEVSAPTGIMGEITAKSLSNTDFPSRDSQYDVSEGSVSFTAPSFEYFSGEKVTGEISYSYSTFPPLTYEDLLVNLNQLGGGDTATVTYTMTLTGNYTGTITGVINLTVIGIVISGVDSDTVEITANPSYGDEIDQIFSLDKSNLSAKDGNGDPILGEFLILVNGNTFTGSDILKPGNYQWELVFRPSDNSGDISLSTGDFTLSPLKVTLSWTGTNLFYTGDILGPTATISNKIGDDVVEVTVTGGQTDVGDYTASASALTGADSGNYVLGSQVTKQFNISDPAQELADKLEYLDSQDPPTEEEIRTVETWYNALSQEAKAAINGKDSSLKPQLDAYIASLSTDSGGSGGSSGTGGTVVGSLTTPYVSVSEGGTISLTPKQAVNGTKVTITILPDSGYELERISVKDSQGKEITVTKQEDGTYIFTQPLTKVTITVEFALISEPESESEPETEPEPELKPDAEEKPQTGYFTDVGAQYWYYDVVYEICDLGLMTGTKVTEFQPETSVTRGMIAQILYNLAEAEPISGNSSFSDVPSHMYYAIPIAWAEENGVVSGYADGTYRPENSVTREELAVLFYAFDRKFNQKPLSGYKSLQYSDNNMISPWAYEYVSWAVQQGLISGKLDDNIDPLGQAQRGELAQILLNYVAMKQS